MKHPDPSHFSAFLEGDLTSREVRDLEEHLSECDACSSLLQDLQDIKRQAGELPDLLPSRDLWPQIAQAIEGEVVQDPDVIRLHPGGPAASSARRRGFHLSIPQAVAAGLALAMFSGGMGGLLVHEADSQRVATQGTAATDGASGPTQEAQWVSMVGEARPALESTALEVARLEQVLAEYRENLDPVTARVLEKNLAVIDKAIGESVSALQADPGNRFLENNLERAVVAKGDYLRDAALLVTPIT